SSFPEVPELDAVVGKVTVSSRKIVVIQLEVTVSCNGIDRMVSKVVDIGKVSISVEQFGLAEVHVCPAFTSGPQLFTGEHRAIVMTLPLPVLVSRCLTIR